MKLLFNYSYMLFSASLIAMLIVLNSLIRKIADKATAAKSAIGPAYTTPSIPKYIGSIITKGSKNKTCLVSDKNIPRDDLPIEVKKLDVNSCTPLKIVNSKKILRYLIPN